MSALAGMTLGAVAHAQVAFRSASSAGVASTLSPQFRAAAAAGIPASTTIAPRLPATSAGVGSGVLTLTINKPTGTVQNDVMVASIAFRAAVADMSTVVLTAPTGWTLVRRTDNAGPTDSNSLAVYSRVAGAIEQTNYAWTFSTSTGAVGGIQAFSSVDTTSPIDVEAGTAIANPGAPLTYTHPGITTTVNNTMILAHFTRSGAGTWIPPAIGGCTPAFTERYDVQIGAAGAGQSLEGGTRCARWRARPAPRPRPDRRTPMRAWRTGSDRNAARARASRARGAWPRPRPGRSA